MKVVYLRVDLAVEAAAVHRAEMLLRPADAWRLQLGETTAALDRFASAITQAAGRICEIIPLLLGALSVAGE